FFLLLITPPPISTLFPYTTLFRSLNLQHHAGHTHAATESIPQVVDANFNKFAGQLSILLGWQLRFLLVGQDEINAVFQTHALTPDRKSTRLNSSHEWISYAVFCLK